MRGSCSLKVGPFNRNTSRIEKRRGDKLPLRNTVHSVQALDVQPGLPLFVKLKTEFRSEPLLKSPQGWEGKTRCGGHPLKAAVKILTLAVNTPKVHFIYFYFILGPSTKTFIVLLLKLHKPTVSLELLCVFFPPLAGSYKELVGSLNSLTVSPTLMYALKQWNLLVSELLRKTDSNHFISSHFPLL